MTLHEALRSAIDLLHSEKRDVFFSCEERRYRLSPSVDARTAHPRGYQICLSVRDADGWGFWYPVDNFDVSDLLREDWSTQTDADLSSGTSSPVTIDMVPRISLVVQRPDGSRTIHVVRGHAVRPKLWEAAEDLVQTIATGERPPLRGLYDLCARAFGTTRDDAKRRIVGAGYGATFGEPSLERFADREPTSIGASIGAFPWNTHLTLLHEDVHARRWIPAAKTLSLLLGHAVEKLVKEST